VSRLRAILISAAALLAALLVGLLLIAGSGVAIGEALAAFWDGIAGSGFALVGSLTRGVPLALVGLGFILADRANLTNVGGEGQIAVGGMFATAAALSWGASKLPGLWPGCGPCWWGRRPARSGAPSPASSRPAAAPTR
jgi:ABC-type uncharacterized transport system permease subunit